ncbi:VOC family protein [Streptomyces xantholiticus]
MALYQQVTGLEPHPKSDGDFTGLNREDGLVIGFQRVDGYPAPRWPDHRSPTASHLLQGQRGPGGSRGRLLELGAGKPDHQPHELARARVLTDPAGHPFCIVRG